MTKYEIIIDSNKIHIVKYIEIIDISYFSIKILLYDREINVIGESLIIRKLDSKELIIDGMIKGIEFIEKQ